MATEARTRLFNIRCTEEERRRWKEQADKYGYVSAAEFLRACVQLWERMENENAITLEEVQARYRELAVVDPASLRLLADRIEEQQAANPFATVSPEDVDQGGFRPW